MMDWPEHGNYPRINRGVHKKAAGRAGAPSLIWHLGVWRDVARSVDKANRITIDTYERSQNDSDKYITELEKRLSTPSKVITFDDYGDLGINKSGNKKNDRGNVATFSFRWHRLYSTVRLESHTEFMTITCIIDASKRPVYQEKESLLSISKSDDVFCSVLRGFNQIELLARRGQYSIGISPDVLNHLLYKAVWDQFDREILQGFGKLPKSIGAVFADFRGIMTSSPSLADRKGRFFSRPFRYGAERRPQSYKDGFPERNVSTGKSWSRSQVIALWPFIECNDKYLDTEFTVSEFLQGRAIYITSLGTLPEHNVKDDKHDPVQFYVQAYSDDRWQLGRLIDRVTQAATARLATIIELDHLHAANDKINKLEQVINQTRVLIHRSLVYNPNSKVRITPASQEDIGKYFEICQNSFSDLNKGFMMGSIEHRTERSNYYLNEFNTAVSALRIQRIEGYQPYDEYVRRRLGGSFSFIKMIRNRVAETKADMTTLYQYYVSLNIAKTATAIENRDEAIREIQLFGETILLALILPYYLSHVMFFLLNSQANDNDLSGKWWIYASIIGAVIALARIAQPIIEGQYALRFSLDSFRKNAIVIMVTVLLGSYLLFSVSQLIGASAPPVGIRRAGAASLQHRIEQRKPPKRLLK